MRSLDAHGAHCANPEDRVALQAKLQDRPLRQQSFKGQSNIFW
jgi:hypothetical protein